MRASVAACCASGSFPLTQGKQVSVTRHRHHRGLIPAHAGKTAAPAWTPGGRPAHSRSGGENWSLRPSHLWMWGSSPLTRGKRNASTANRSRIGLIPAHAGKTSSPRATTMATWAHPRSRGENFTPRLEQGQNLGSSPLTRGKPANAWGGSAIQRLIPAHAGKTLTPAGRLVIDGAHPRSRGENRLSMWLTHRGRGSSPLTRGKHRAYPGDQGHAGLIPAHAGKTS